jgi:hypothetical protein
MAINPTREAAGATTPSQPPMARLISPRARAKAKPEYGPPLSTTAAAAAAVRTSIESPTFTSISSVKLSETLAGSLRLIGAGK